MNNSTICDQYYSDKITDKHASNIFVEGATIYSYGHHFPMAIRIKSDLHIWNEDGYSVTTAKHKNYAYPRFDYIPVNTDLAQSWDHAVNYGYDLPKDKTIQYLKDKIFECTKKMNRARTKKNWWSSEINRYNHAIELINGI